MTEQTKHETKIIDDLEFRSLQDDDLAETYADLAKRYPSDPKVDVEKIGVTDLINYEGYDAEFIDEYFKLCAILQE